MIIVEGFIRLAPGEIERLRPAAVAMMQATHAESGCLDYAYAIDMADAQKLRVIERWQDQAALDAHFASPHMATFNQAIGGAVLLGGVIKAYAGEEVRTLVEIPSA